MLLTESQIEQAIEQAKTAFPNFIEWEYNNKKNYEYDGFSLWGEFVVDPENIDSRSFFITLDTYQQKWRGYLTIGQHAYFWSSADMGDAYLVDTNDCDSIEDAIVQLKTEILNLFRAFSVI